MSARSRSPTSPPPPLAEPKGQHRSRTPMACSLCRKDKAKCNRPDNLSRPCDRCLKRKVGAKCHYISVAAEKRADESRRTTPPIAVSHSPSPSSFDGAYEHPPHLPVIYPYTVQYPTPPSYGPPASTMDMNHFFPSASSSQGAMNVMVGRQYSNNESAPDHGTSASHSDGHQAAQLTLDNGYLGTLSYEQTQPSTTQHDPSPHHFSTPQPYATPPTERLDYEEYARTDPYSLDSTTAVSQPPRATDLFWTAGGPQGPQYPQASSSMPSDFGMSRPEGTFYESQNAWTNYGGQASL